MTSALVAVPTNASFATASARPTPTPLPAADDPDELQAGLESVGLVCLELGGPEAQRCIDKPRDELTRTVAFSARGGRVSSASLVMGGLASEALTQPLHPTEYELLISNVLEDNRLEDARDWLNGVWAVGDAKLSLAELTLYKGYAWISIERALP